jgi:hypothetical protein
MANNQLIKGAALTSKKFVDVGAAVGDGINYSKGSGNYKNPRVAKNQAIQAKVNAYMGKMKTDMDFTSFSPGETATMRSFLVDQRDKYAEAAKMAASFSDTSDPAYMEHVDIMNGVNNSFTNLAKQLESYKTGKVEYAQGQLDGIYSDGTDEEVATDTAAMYGFWDHDDDASTKKQGGANSPFQIMAGGNLGFNINGREVSYNGSPPLIDKDYKTAIGIIKDNESAYTAGKPQNKNSLKAYRLQLEQQLRNQNTVKSLIFDFNDELDTQDLQDAISEGSIDMTQAREEFINRMVNSRQQVSQEGYNNKVSKSQANYNQKETQRIARLKATATLKGKTTTSYKKSSTSEEDVRKAVGKKLKEHLDRDPTPEEITTAIESSRKRTSSK